MQTQSGKELDPRQRVLLRAVVIEYVKGAEPVASELLTQKYELGVKSATVRNELAEMSERGYLEQPHTSAGRIPSNKGYRYFVDFLVAKRDLSSDQRQTVKSATSEGELLESLLRESTGALSRLTHLLGAATLVQNASLSVRSALVSALGPHQALFVLVLGNGHAESRVVECPSGLTLEDVGKANELILQAVAGKSLRAIHKSKAPGVSGNASLEKLLAVIWSSVRSIAKDLTKGQVLTEGEEFLFGQPEFTRNAESLSDLIDTLRSNDVLYDALSSPEQTGTVTIGTEHRAEKMHKLSVVKNSFYVGETEAGTIALVGPTRMEYESSIPLVNFTAKALTEALTRFFG